MHKMHKLEVGKPYPHPFHRQDSMTAVLDGASLTLLVVLMGMSKRDEQILRNGSMLCGVYAHGAIPVILCAFKGCAEFDAHINIHKEPTDRRDAFFAAEEPTANMLQIYAIDGNTGILRGIRVIGTPANFIPDIKALCFEQLTRYASATAVDAAVVDVQQHSIKHLMTQTRMFVTDGN